MAKANSWKIGVSEEDRQILSKVFASKNLEQSARMADAACKVIIKHKQDKNESQLSLSSRNLLVVLHGYSKGPITAVCYELATEIDEKLTSL